MQPEAAVADSSVDSGLDASTVPDASSVPDAAPVTYDSSVTARDAGTVSATLQGLHASRGELTPSFDPAITHYRLELPLATSNVRLTPTAAEAVTILIGDTKVSSSTAWQSAELSVGETDVTIEVTAPGLSARHYDLVISRSTLPLYLKSSAPDVTGFGGRFALSGNTLVVTGHEDTAAAIDVWIDTQTGWQLQAHLRIPTPSGTAGAFSPMISVAIDGDTLVVGAARQQDNQSLNLSGAAYVFERQAGTWGAPSVLRASAPTADADFGESVAVSGDVIAIGAPFDDDARSGHADSGVVYVFARSAGNWQEQARLVTSNAGAGDGFGASVAVSGDTVVASAPLEDSGASGVNGEQNDESAADSGAVYVFTRSGMQWSQQAYLKSSKPAYVTQQYGGDGFGGGESLMGRGVALSGDTLAVGAAGEDIADDADGGAAILSDVGAVYMFARSAGQWSSAARLTAFDVHGGDQFGGSVALAADRLLVGAWQNDSDAVGLNGVAHAYDATRTGAAYSFTHGAAGWTKADYLKAANPDNEDDFGWSVAASESVLAVGAPYEDGASTGLGGDPQNNDQSGAGAVYLFP